MNEFTVIGAGMAGLLAAALLRDECSQVIEAAPALPNNHSALLRFRSSVVGDALNIPFTPVNVIKAVKSLGNPIADAISYSLKTNGNATLRSVTTANGEIERRFIAPHDFIPRMAAKVTAPIQFGKKWELGAGVGERLVISTMPMPLLMGILGYQPLPLFTSVHGWTATAKLSSTNFCGTLYLPSKEDQPYRVSVTNDRLIVEYAFPHMSSDQAAKAMKWVSDYPANQQKHLHEILQMIGMDSSFIVGKPEFKPQPYAKILPISDTERKRFILWASEEHNIYSFGRFATWRPGLLLDDLVEDLRVIQRLANGATSYDARKDK